MITKKLTEGQRTIYLQSTEAALTILNRDEPDLSELGDVLDPMMDLTIISKLYEALVSENYPIHDAICELEGFHTDLLVYTPEKDS